MRLTSFLQQLREAGIILRYNGEKLVCDAPREALTPDILAALKERKKEIISFLQLASSAVRRPFFFGSPARRLFAIHHLPEKQGREIRAVLLCNALGREYSDSHWALRQLANALAKKGHHVLRFDYFGTGDSDGETEGFTFEGMREDVVEAAQKLLSLSGCDAVTLVGVRVGGTFLSQMQFPDIKIEELVLWDPIIDGEIFIRDQDDTICNVLSDHLPGINGITLTKAREELDSFFFPPGCYEQICKIDLLLHFECIAERILIVTTEPGSLDEKLVTSLSSSGMEVRCRRIVDQCEWNSFEPMFHVVFPHKTINCIVNELA